MNKEQNISNESSMHAIPGKVNRVISGRGPSVHDWWPNLLNLRILHQCSPLVNPMGKKFNYAEEFKTLDLKAVKNDLYQLMTNAQEGGLRPLWTLVSPDGVAQRVDLPHRRWPRWGWIRLSAPCTP